MESGRALVVAVNKWDGLDVMVREEVKRVMARKLQFLHWAKFHFISAMKGAGIDALMRSVDAAYGAATLKLSTPKITRVLREAVEAQQPPRHGRFRPKLRYAHQAAKTRRSSWFTATLGACFRCVQALFGVSLSESLSAGGHTPAD